MLNDLNRTNMEQMVNLYIGTWWIFFNRLLVIIEGDIIFLIKPPLWGEDRVLYDGAKVASKKAQYLLNAMK